tara:strand:+ start:3690 stop:5900 length:2211 start_codon:yes stop_codon:yes gene_type:complete
MTIKLLKRFIKESLGREIFADPQMFADSDAAALVQKQLTKVKTIDKTKLSVKDTLKDLILAAGPETYIRFQNKFDDEDGAPALEVSPNVQFQTPHGIYGYPLGQDNLQNLVIAGKPTNADFAVNYMFFHVYKINKSKTANVEKNTKDTNIIQGRYSNKRKVIDDIAECIRLSSVLLKQGRTAEADEQTYLEFEKDIQRLRTRKYEVGIDLSEVFKKYSSFTGTNSKSLFDIYKVEIAESIYIRVRESISKRYSNVSKQFSFFVILKEAISYIASTISDVNETSKGQYFSLLLKAVGISGISDYATGTIHPNEPSQSVSFDFSGNTIEPIGTYRNIFKNISDNEEERNKYVEEFESILESLESKNLVVWDVKENKDIQNYDFKNLSLKGFVSVLNYIRKDEVKLFDFISNVAEKNNHTNVINYIYKNFKDFKSISRIPILNFLLKNEVTKISESHMKEFYKESVKPKLNVLDKEGVYLGSAREFVRSSSLPKYIMLDIIKNTSNKGWELHGRFRQDPLIDELSVSKVLDNDVCDAMIKKFGIEKLSFLKFNQSAPVTENLVDEINSMLSGETLEQKSNEDISKILSLVSLVFGNKHIQKDDYIYLCNLCSLVFKNNYGKNYKKNENQDNIMIKFSIQGAIESLIFNKHFDRQILDDMNITIQEEVNILHNILEGPWANEFSFDSDDFQDDKSSSASAPPTFDLYKHGISYLDQYYKGEELKYKLSRAYNFITAKQKI